MPIYEYQCAACRHRLETLQKLRDAPLKTCPVCGKPALKKLVSAAGFRLKGGGWYETDFKSGNKRNVVDGGDPPAKEAKTPKDQTVPETASPKTEKPAEIKKPVKAASP